MKSHLLLLIFCTSVVAALPAWAQPVVSNVRSAQQLGTTQVIITYDLTHAQGQSSAVTVEVSPDGGATYASATGATGAVGAGISPGLGKTVTWDAGVQWPAQFRSNARARVTATDAPVAPTGFVLIPAGTFTMGSVVISNTADTSDGITDATPHQVTLSAFYLATTETTWSDWVAVRDWAVTHGYTDLASVGRWKATTHPVWAVSWYDVVKWCNAKSEKDGLVPVYYTDDAQTTVYRTGNVNVTNAQVKWTANGYRLPTEAEWEYAARGGLAGKRFPWGDTITHMQANYRSLTFYSYDVSTTRGYHPTYATGSEPYTSPVGSFAVNGYGLADMAGNVWEWCWDWSGSYGSAAVTAPQGASSSSYRVIRGGGWKSSAGDFPSAARAYAIPSYRDSFFNVGFRAARSLVP